MSTAGGKEASALRVAMLGSLPPLRGISAYCAGLAQSVGNRVPVEFINFKAMYPAFLYPGRERPEDATFPPLRSARLTVRRTLAWYNPFGWVREGLRVRADVLHVQHWSLPLAPIFLTVAGLARLRGIRLAVTLHNIRPHESSRLYHAATWLMARLADRCIVHSEDNRVQAIRLLGLSPDRVQRIPIGTSPPGNPPPADRAVARRRLELPPDAPVALCFGTIRPYKGVDVLIRAFARVVAKMPDALLLVAGKPWGDWTPYQRLIADFGLERSVRVRLGYIPDVEVGDLFAAADVTPLPYTHFDAQSAVALLALGFGRPLIVSRVGGLPELVSDARCIVPPNDAAALAEALLRVLGDVGLRAQLEADARRAAQRCSWDAVAEETIAFYRTLLAASDVPRREAP